MGIAVRKRKSRDGQWTKPGHSISLAGDSAWAPRHLRVAIASEPES